MRLPTPPAGRPLETRAGRLADALIATSLGLLVLAVHDVGYLLRAPYWLDESWVAVAAKVPLRDLPLVSASSPLGWTLLVRLQGLGGAQRQRLVPLAFAGLAVAVGYLVLRAAGSNRVAAALAGGGTVLLVPAMLIRDDLKQYTADAAVFLLVLGCVTRLESRWSRRRLMALSVVVALSPLVSTAAVLNGPAAFGALVVVAAVRRDLLRLRESLVAGVLAGVVLLAVLFATVERNANPSLRGFWAGYYLPRTPDALVRVVWRRMSGSVMYLGVPHLWLALALVASGVVVLVSRGRPATALVLPLALAGTAAAAAAHAYPFLDLRTSTWLFAGTALFLGLGVAGPLEALTRGSAGPRRWAAVVLAVAATAYAGTAADPWLRWHGIFAQDVRSQVQWVEAHRTPGDVVVVTLSASWAYAYYSRLDPVPVRPTQTVATGFVPALSGDPRLVAMTSRGPLAVESAVAEARRRASGSGRVWVVSTQVAADERPVWNALVGRCGESVDVGVDPLLVLTPGRC